MSSLFLQNRELARNLRKLRDDSERHPHKSALGNQNSLLIPCFRLWCKPNKGSTARRCGADLR